MLFLINTYETNTMGGRQKLLSGFFRLRGPDKNFVAIFAFAERLSACATLPGPTSFHKSRTVGTGHLKGKLGLMFWPI